MLVTCLLAAALGGAPKSDTSAQPFPMVVLSDRGQDGIELALNPLAIEPLEQLGEARLLGMPLPGGGTVDLLLKRVQLGSTASRVVVDGLPVEDTPAVSLWHGEVPGFEGSEAFFAFSPLGSRGWVTLAGATFELLAFPDSDGSWTRSTSVLLGHDRLSALAGPPKLACAGSPMPTPSTAPGPRLATISGLGGGLAASAPTLPYYECHIAVETDYQFYQIFNNLPAAQAYAAALLGAVAGRYREQVGVIFTFPYLGFHTNSNDGWVAQENGGGSVGLLFEFQAAWQNGGGPVTADVYHFLSGANLGGGVAYIPAVCDQGYGFGVSGNLGGNTPFPVSPGWLNWDFIVVAHELGHNFNAPHTHDYCPPLDECAPPGYFGACQTQNVCTTQGTVMSYCHICGNGMPNMTTFFHPQSVADMRAYTTSSCLTPFQGVLNASSYGAGLAGSNGVPQLSVGFQASPTEQLVLSATQAPVSQLGVLLVGESSISLPFLGGTLVTSAEYGFVFSSTASGTASVSIPVGGLAFAAGLTLFAQGWWINNATTFASSAGLSFELIVL